MNKFITILVTILYLFFSANYILGVSFIYDIKKYDKVFIVTDSEYKGSKGVNSLINALCSAGNTDISLIRWCSDL